MRLPVYLLLDTSGSMSGEPIEAVKNGVQVLVSSLRQNPYALETASLSVITFDSSVRQIIPLTDLVSFQMPEISASGGTSLGEGLRVLSQCMDKEVVKSTAEKKGDWKPLVFLLTDGAPTDDWQSGLAELNKRRPGMLVACAAGVGADTSILQQITKDVVRLDTTDSAAIKEYFKWISGSIVEGSKKVDSGAQGVAGLNELPPPPPEVNVVF